MGIDLPGHRHGDRVSCATVVPIDRRRLADSCVLGHRASPVGQSHLAVHADFRVRLHDLRQHDAPVVPRRRAIVPEAPVRRDARRPCLNDGYAEPPNSVVTWSAVDDGHVPFVVALAGGRHEVVQPFDLVGAQLDAFGGGVLLDAGNSLGASGCRHRPTVDDVLRPGDRPGPR